MKAVLLLFLSIIILTSCERKSEYRSIPFEEAQPLNSKNEHSIAASMHGSYFSLTDSSLLYISDNIIRMQYFIPQEMAMAEGDTNSSIRMVEQNDTLLNLNDTRYVLRKYKGFYFLNEKLDDGWNVIQLHHKKNCITFSSISPGDSLAPVSAITNINAIQDDSGNVVSISVNPTKKELKQLMKKGLFLGREIWVKIKE